MIPAQSPLRYRPLVSPRTAASLAFAWGAFFVWTPLYEGLDGGVLEEGVTGVALRGASAIVHALVARYALRLRSRGAAALLLMVTAFTIAAAHRGYWMVRLAGPVALSAVGTLCFGPLLAAVCAAFLAPIGQRVARDSSDEGTDRALIAAAMWALLYINASTCRLLDGFVVPTLVPLAAIFAGYARIQWRRQWLAEVAAPNCPFAPPEDRGILRWARWSDLAWSALVIAAGVLVYRRPHVADACECGLENVPEPAGWRAAAAQPYGPDMLVDRRGLHTVHRGNGSVVEAPMVCGRDAVEVVRWPQSTVPWSYGYREIPGIAGSMSLRHLPEEDVWVVAAGVGTVEAPSERFVKAFRTTRVKQFYEQSVEPILPATLVVVIAHAVCTLAFARWRSTRAKVNSTRLERAAYRAAPFSTVLERDALKREFARACRRALVTSAMLAALGLTMSIVASSATPRVDTRARDGVSESSSKDCPR